MAEATTDPIQLPPGPNASKLTQTLVYVFAKARARTRLTNRYGSGYSLNLPKYGPTLVISDPAMLKELFTSGNDLVTRPTTLGKLLGPGSILSMMGVEHRQRRKLMVPPFSGRRIDAYVKIVEEEFLREAQTWPEETEFESLQALVNITGSIVLRTILGAHGAIFEELQYLGPRTIVLAARMIALPEWLRRDLGPWSPWGKIQAARSRFDELIAQLIAEARADPNFEIRTDMLAMMLQARYDDGSPITDAHISDEMLTMIVAGHETTATTLAWAVERLRRSPSFVAQLVDEIDNGGTALMQATVWEVQRTRPVLDFIARRVETQLRLGPWVLPKGHMIVGDVWAAQHASCSFKDPERFDPTRFADGPPESYAWIPFGGGIHRCIGAAFANMEMTTVLRTLLRKFELVPTDAPAEPIRSRGITNAPGHGGRIVVRSRPGGARAAYASEDGHSAVAQSV
ncbi:putative cytochrome P450 138 [Mycobacterium marinum]|uniref:cytochrome P450 n=1 Tax=Mycobacterium marinum TaxID=1781 RepID=UPI000E3E34BE|nr:cytochrome P450 [Mycobacterium marinum]RFZ40621.1 Epi-isozizaene 5-monooxygenase/(E)-beta-farnesene synthase [Mycobacterium marinum]GJO95555.1 putative cytochrome P450 138 [Mycobacterium marinum]